MTNPPVPQPAQTDPLRGLKPVNLTETRETLILKGPAGSGKTSGAASYASQGKVFVIQADKNSKALARAMKEHGEDKFEVYSPTWNEYAKQIAPAIMNRALDVDTILVDTISSLVEDHALQLKGDRQKLEFDDYNAILTGLQMTTGQITSAAVKREGDPRPAYRVIFTCHLQDLTKKVKVGNQFEDVLERWEPKVIGSFRQSIENYFDNVLLCEHTSTKRVVEEALPGGKTRNKTIDVREFKLYSSPPDRYHTCKGIDLPSELTVPYGERLCDVLDRYWRPGDETNNNQEN